MAKSSTIVAVKRPHRVEVRRPHRVEVDRVHRVEVADDE